MKLMKRATALLLCFLMLTNGPISAFATEGVSDNDVVLEISPAETTDTTVSGNDVGCPECRQIDVHLPICSHYEAISTVEETSDYSGDIGKHAFFNAEDNFHIFKGALTKPASLADLKPVNKNIFSTDILFEITEYELIKDVSGETPTTALLYKVEIVQGSANKQEFSNGFWILQKYLESNYYQDVLTLSTPSVEPPVPEEPNEVTGTVGGNTVTVSGNIPEDTQLYLEEAELSKIPEYDSETKFGIGDRPYIAMDISLLRGEEEYQPTESVSVTMGVSGVASAGEDVLVYHVHENEDGTVTPEILGPFQVDENGFVTFAMSRFSYVLVFTGEHVIEDVEAFYPGTLEGSDSTNDQLTFLGVYYDKDSIAHFLLAFAGNTNAANAEDKFKHVTIDATTYNKSDVTYSMTGVQFSYLILMDKSGNTVYTSPESDKKGYGGVFDITLGDIQVRDGFFFGVNNQDSGNGWRIGGNLVLELDYELIKTVAAGTSTAGVFEDSVTVDRGDWVIFKINVNNNGTRPLTDMLVKDFLPDDVFDMNTVQMSIDGENGEIGNWQPFNQTLFDHYDSAGKFERTLYIKAQVDPNLSITEDTTYTNKATIDGMNMPTYEDTASVVVKAPTTGTLTVSKAVTSENPNDSAPDTEFTFTIHSDAENAADFQYTKSDGTIGSVANNGTFILENGESIVFSGFPVGNFTVAEAQVPGFTTKINGSSVDADGGKITHSGNMPGDGSPVVAFENQFATRMATLTITKTVEQDYPNDTPVIPEDGFEFTVVFGDGTDTTTEYPFTIGNTTGTIISGGKIKLSDGQTAVISNIPVGTAYKVTENLRDLAGDYKTTVNGDENVNYASGTIQLDNNTVNVVNTYKQHCTDLTITKTGAQTNLDENQSFIFDVGGPDEFEVTVTINGNGSVTIKDVPFGQYTVTENTDWSWRYTPTDGPRKTINLVANGENKVTFNNNRSWIYWLSGDIYNENQFTVKSKEDEE